MIWYKCAHVCISILSRNTCHFCFHFLLIHYIFHVLPSFIPARLRYSFFSWDFYFVWTNITSKYTLYWTRIRNSVSGRKLITIRLLISTSSFCKTVIINFGVEVILAQHDVGAFINYNRLSIKQASREKFLTACLTHWPITGSRGPSVVNI